MRILLRLAGCPANDDPQTALERATFVTVTLPKA